MSGRAGSSSLARKISRTLSAPSEAESQGVTRASIAEDHNGDPVFLARNAWHLDRAQQDFPKLKFLKIKEQPH